MSEYLLLDLFCGAGGCAKGYADAGFEVIGVDHEPQPNYPFDFIQLDAIDFLNLAGAEDFDAIHASPPCQAYSTANNRYKGKGGAADDHLALVAPVRRLLERTTKPWVIEQPVASKKQMRAPILLHGGMFNLAVNRPRFFESNVPLVAPAQCSPPKNSIGVYGTRPDGRWLYERQAGGPQRAASSLDEAQRAMGIDWMTWRELCEAIPPAYTRYVGRQLWAYLEVLHNSTPST